MNPPSIEGAKTRDRETSDGNDGENTSNEHSKSKGRGHLRSAPTTAQPSSGSKRKSMPMFRPLLPAVFFSKANRAAGCPRRTWRRRRRWAGRQKAATSYEQGTAVVEEDEEMEREDERGVAKRPDLNELDRCAGMGRAGIG
jgi:hypothetical protein